MRVAVLLSVSGSGLCGRYAAVVQLIRIGQKDTCGENIRKAQSKAGSPVRRFLGFVAPSSVSSEIFLEQHLENTRSSSEVHECLQHQQSIYHITCFELYTAYTHLYRAVLGQGLHYLCLRQTMICLTNRSPARACIVDCYCMHWQDVNERLLLSPRAQCLMWLVSLTTLASPELV